MRKRDRARLAELDRKAVEIYGAEEVESNREFWDGLGLGEKEAVIEVGELRRAIKLVQEAST